MIPPKPVINPLVAHLACCHLINLQVKETTEMYFPHNLNIKGYDLQNHSLKYNLNYHY